MEQTSLDWEASLVRSQLSRMADFDSDSDYSDSETSSLEESQDNQNEQGRGSNPSSTGVLPHVERPGTDTDRVTRTKEKQGKGAQSGAATINELKERDLSRDFTSYYATRPIRVPYTLGQDTGRQIKPQRGLPDVEMETWPLMRFNPRSEPKTLSDMPPGLIALEDPWAFLCILFYKLGERYRRWPNDFAADGRMRLKRPPVGGGVYVYFVPTRRYYMLESFGCYLLGGDTIGSRGKWVYRHPLKVPKGFPELSFGNFRMPVTWSPSSNDLVLRYKLKSGTESKLVMVSTEWARGARLVLPRFFLESDYVLSEWSYDEETAWTTVDGSAERNIVVHRTGAQKNKESQVPVESGSEQSKVGVKRTEPPTAQIRDPKKRHSAPGTFDSANSHVPSKFHPKEPTRASSGGTLLQQQLFPDSTTADRHKTSAELMNRSASSSASPSFTQSPIPEGHILVKKSDLDQLRAQRDLFYEEHLRNCVDWSTMLDQQKAVWTSEVNELQVLVEANNKQFEALKARFVRAQDHLVTLEGLATRGPRNSEDSVTGFPPSFPAFEKLKEDVAGTALDEELSAIRNTVERTYERLAAQGPDVA